MIISICPSFYCKNKCTYCYLGNLVQNKSILSLEKLINVLKEIPSKYISNIDLYGGELSLLDSTYLFELKNIVESFTFSRSITTSLYNNKILDIFNNWNISVSLNEERPDYFKILQKIKKYPYLQLAVVVLPSIINKSSYDILNFLEELKIKSVSFLKYSPSVLSKYIYKITDDEYENKIINLIDTWLENTYTFDLINYRDIKSCFNKEYSPLMKENVYINYDGKFGYLKYSPLESFCWVNTFQEFLNVCENEEKEYFLKCNTCDYYNFCYTEHLNFSKKCSGNKRILEYAKNNWMCCSR